jgi:ACS/CODH beta subunit-like protein
MSSDNTAGHSHGVHTTLGPDALATLRHGLTALMDRTQGLAFQPVVSDMYPLPVCAAVCGGVPEADAVRARIRQHVDADPVAVLEQALVLLELLECNRPEAAEHLPNDAAFTGVCFASKRLNGWIAQLGDADAAALEDAVNARWQFRFFAAPERTTSLYVLLNMLTRYGFVYGRIEPGDSHAMGHFIEEFTPGVLICSGHLTDVELTLALAAMKLGVPAVVPHDFPFPLGRRAEADTLDEISDAVVAFPNIRRLLDLPGIAPLPEYLDPAAVSEEFDAATVWGDTDESFCLLRKGPVDAASVETIGVPDGALGVLITIDAEPMDALDRRHIEAGAVRALSMMHGVHARHDGARLVLEMARGVELPPERIGEALIAVIRHDFPKIAKVHVQVICDPVRLAELRPEVEADLAAREAEIAAMSEDTIQDFVTCIGCSPFAPDHVCILTPERTPQCGRAYDKIKVGALYGLDDMSNIHHRAIHAGVNSFGTCAKGVCLDEVAGEWSGVNEAAARLTGGRTTRVQLHSLDEAPHTGCGCFRLIMFKTDAPRPGIGIMRSTYKGRAPDGRTWRALHYSLAGKQTPGVAGASPAYLKSPKFLAAHDGWDSVVWVSPEIADYMGDDLPDGVEVGPVVE